MLVFILKGDLFFLSKGAELVSPVMGAMQGRLNESLNAEIAVRLAENGRILFEAVGRHAGLEVVYPEKLTAGMD